MHRFWQLLTDTRTIAVIGFAGLAALLFFGASRLEVALVWAVLALGVALCIWLAVFLVKRWRARRAASALGDMLQQQTDKPTVLKTSGSKPEEVEAIRKRMLEAIATIKTSKLGLRSGSEALYTLPWYMVIGNPAAGKSTAIANSGLQFPLADKTGKIVQGVGGTRNCDWFFTTEGILIDTAGRYSVYDDDRDEWFSFLGLLKKYRRQAPINGIIVAVSIAELTGTNPKTAEDLAKSLRMRIQELTERLGVFAPVYLMFTKVDLITGFNEFFLDSDRGERDRVWGATLPYKRYHTGKDVLQFFDARFDELYDGLKEMSLATMALNRSGQMAPGVLTFPLEFASVKNALRAFIATLFAENPFQFKPVLRGFYFTSGLQEGAAVSSSSQRVADRFALTPPVDEVSEVYSHHGFFLLNLFKQVIFPDQQLVSQYASLSKTRLRTAAFLAATALVGLALGGWSWSYLANRQLTANVQADLDKAIRLQEKRLDLQARFEALEILQDRIEQLDAYRNRRPLSLGFGLYQGEALERKLRQEYFAGINQIMLKPVTATIEAFLSEVNRNADKLTPMTRPPQLAGAITAVPPIQLAGTPAAPYQDLSPTNVEDAYNVLKTYLMLSDKSRAEASHLNDQITRLWRVWLETNRGAMPREQMIRSAERLISFSLAQINDPAWPATDLRLSLVDQSRDNLRRVVRGMPARDRVYADVKARASTRFSGVTVAQIVGEQDKNLIVGSHAVAGTFTREAWEKYIENAFKEAASKELQSADWVLKTASNDDLTLEGSPEQIQKALVSQYKAEYAKQWQSFMQGVAVADLNGFDAAVAAMNRLGDPLASPIERVITAVYQQTSWDNPALVNQGLARAQEGFTDWIKNIFSRTPSPVKLDVNLNTAGASIPKGTVGKEFAGVAKLVAAKDRDATLMRAYLESLSRLRSRFNQIKNQGDTGPGAKQLMQQTLEGSGSELSEALKYVDEQMLTGMSDAQKQALRPLLVRPLIQAFAVIVRPAESEINKVWLAQVYEPYQKTLAGKYPFSPNAKIEANNAEIGTIFGTEGAIAKFFSTSMGPLVVRRGDTLAARTWANMGVTLSPELVTNFASWVSPQGAAGSAAPTGGAAQSQTVFQLKPTPAPGTLEYTVEIDGQQLRYRNTPAQWTNFVWPNPQGTPGARVTAVLFDGRTIEVANQPGRFGLERLINSATRTRKEGGVFALSWNFADTAISVDLKVISSPQVSGAAPSVGGTSGLRSLRLPETIVAADAGTGLSATAPANSAVMAGTAAGSAGTATASLTTSATTGATTSAAPSLTGAAATTPTAVATAMATTAANLPTTASAVPAVTAAAAASARPNIPLAVEGAK